MISTQAVAAWLTLVTLLIIFLAEADAALEDGGFTDECERLCVTNFIHQLDCSTLKKERLHQLSGLIEAREKTAVRCSCDGKEVTMFFDPEDHPNMIHSCSVAANCLNEDSS